MTERVTHSLVRDVDLEDLGTLALVTLDNGADATKPNTLGPVGMAEMERALTQVARRARAGELIAVGVTGKPFHFAAGADLYEAARLAGTPEAAQVAGAGHRAYRILQDLPVPTFAYISGVALGGGLELALSCTYRTVAASVRGIGLPEVSLGLVPGWSGTYLLPGLVGIRSAVEVILANPLKNNTQLSAQGAVQMGVADACFSPADFLASSLRWSARVLRGDISPERPAPEDEPTWRAIMDEAEAMVTSRLHGAAPAAPAAVDLLRLSQRRDREASFAAEESALTRLIGSPEFAASMYAFNLTGHRAKHPAGAPPAQSARPVTSVGIAGAGLMASQLALLVARRMKVPVIMRDLEAERAERGRSFVASEVAGLAQRGRISPDEANRITSLVSVTTDLADLAQADLVIEAVFEELEVKQQVFAELEQVVGPETILATNTSALSVSAMARGLQHPERVVGLHFFNPVAQMPLVEVVRADHTDEASYATAFAVASACRKSAIAVADRPGFIVNRLLVRLLGEVLGSLEEGTTVADADAALRPMGLPMGPFQLLQLVGPAVAAHVLHTLRADLGERYPDSPGLDRMVETGRPFVTFDERPTAASPVDVSVGDVFGARVSEPGTAAQTPAELLARVQRALAQEVTLMMADGVVAELEDIDLGMILGAGWPFWLGGITPYLRRSGALAQ